MRNYSLSILLSLGLSRSGDLLKSLIWNGSNPRSKQDNVFGFDFVSILMKHTVCAWFVSPVRSYPLQCTVTSSLLTTWPSAATTTQAAHSRHSHSRSREHLGCPVSQSLMSSSLQVDTNGWREPACTSMFLSRLHISEGEYDG